MVVMNENLAIIIPAFKGSFLRETLNSIAKQTNLDFTVYIGDDCSPFDLHKIVDEFKDSIRIVYHRFPSNFGSEDLIAQWDRCIGLSTCESWIWLFSDDDVMSPDCVDSFYKGLSDNCNMFDVYRFKTKRINEKGITINELVDHPKIETSCDFLIRKLSRQVNSYAVEYIFSRKIFNSKGFVRFPLGWASDDATWALFGKENGIYTLDNAFVQWRYSGLNLSSNIESSYKYKKLDAVVEYINWISLNFRTAILPLILWNWIEFQCNLLNLSRYEILKFKIRITLFTKYRVEFLKITISPRIHKLFNKLFRVGTVFIHSK